MSLKRKDRFARLAPLIALLTVVLASQAGMAQQLVLSADQAFIIDADAARDVSVWYQSGLGTQSFSLLLPPVELQSVHLDLDEKALFGTVGQATRLIDGTVITPRDILRLGSPPTLEVPGESLGLPMGVAIDALSREGGEWIVSLDRTTQIMGMTVRDSEVLRLGGSGVEILFSANEQGLPPGIDIDGVHLDTDLYELYLSFDQPGRVSGTTFDDDTVLIFSLDNESWRTHYDPSGDGSLSLWEGIDVDAISITPEIFADSFESKGLSRWSTVVQ